MPPAQKYFAWAMLALFAAGIAGGAWGLLALLTWALA